MQTYHVKLESPVSDSFRCVRAANSLDIDAKKKSIHELKIDLNLEEEFNVGVIVGSSGSGKTTLAKKIFGEECFLVDIKEDLPVIDQFPKELSYEDCSAILSGIGLTSVPCWIRPVYTLSNGQKARAIAALLLAKAQENKIVAIDEWTSVVDRTVAKVMSHCLQKHARKYNKKIILCSCHFDILEWIDPDWVVDCNSQKFIDRRILSSEERKKKEVLSFGIKECPKDSWKFFSKYHYLSETLPGGRVFMYGLYNGIDQIGFMCFANYVPKHKGKRFMYHSNRVVVHPDYAGMGIGLRFVNECCKLLKEKELCDIYATFSSTPMLRARLKDKENWNLINVERRIGKFKNKGIIGRNKKGSGKGSFRENVKLYCFRYVGK